MTVALARVGWKCPSCEMDWIHAVPVGQCPRCMQGLREAERETFLRAPQRLLSLAGVPEFLRTREAGVDAGAWESRMGCFPTSLVGWRGDPEQNHIVCIFGGPGSGKSGLAVALLLQAFDRWRDASACSWVSMPEWLDLGITGRGLDFGSERFQRTTEMRERVRKAAVLVLDGVFADGLGSLDENQTVSRILRVRYEGKRPTILTTNTKPQDLRSVETTRGIASMLGDRSATIGVNLGTTDRRLV